MKDKFIMYVHVAEKSFENAAKVKCFDTGKR